MAQNGIAHQTPMDLPSIRALYASGQTTPAAVITALYPRLEASGCVFIHLAPLSQLLAQAEALMAIPSAERSPLWGVPCAVKDNVDVGGMPTTAACPAFSYTPEASGPAVAALEKAGARSDAQRTRAHHPDSSHTALTHCLVWATRLRATQVS